eukprot:scaffold5101_cov403-Prasinococcus_capsulatus_cf.AAC.3
MSVGYIALHDTSNASTNSPYTPRRQHQQDKRDPLPAKAAPSHSSSDTSDPQSSRAHLAGHDHGKEPFCQKSELADQVDCLCPKGFTGPRCQTPICKPPCGQVRIDAGNCCTTSPA